MDKSILMLYVIVWKGDCRRSPKLSHSQKESFSWILDHLVIK